MYLLASLFGLAWGVLVAWLGVRRNVWLPFLCCGVILIIVAVQLSSTGVGGSIPGVIIGGSIVLGYVVAAGIVWKHHPALRGMRFGARVRELLFNSAAIRAHRGGIHPQTARAGDELEG